MYTNRNAIACGLSADSGLPGCIHFYGSEYRYSMLWFSLVIGFLQKKYTENLEVMKFFILSLSLSLWYRALRYRLFFNFQRVKRAFFRWISYFSRSFSVFRRLLSLPPPFPAESAVHHTFRRYAVYGYAMPVCRRSRLCIHRS